MEPRHELEEITLRFIQAWEEGEAPTLEAYLREYPQLGPELTEFAAAFFEAGARVVPAAEADAAEADPALQRVLALLRGEGTTLREVRKAAGWTPAQLARKLNLPQMAVLWLERGTLRDWPLCLEIRLGELLCRSREQIGQMLRAATPDLLPAASHFRAQGVPHSPTPRVRSFAEALAECDRLEQLTDAQRREWLPEAD